MRRLAYFIRSVIRFLALWVVDGISLLLVAWILPGVRFTPAAVGDRLVVALEAAFVLSLVNLLIRPFILMVARPLGFI
jgi:uncharacterized membrane protein YvlD (DUF360 family)